MGLLFISPGLISCLFSSISDARENVQRFTDRFSFGGSGRGAEDSRADQAANEWGRSGKDPNHFRPHGLPDKY